MTQNILHLSDIHFKYAIDGTIHDLDHDVRNELAIDVVHLTEKIGPIGAIVVTGDIAFAGRSEDYEAAKTWLESLCSKIGCAPEHVWVVPGNHDIDRDKVTPIVRMTQNTIQEAATSELDNCIRQYVHDDPSGAALLSSPLSDYRKFASIYGCNPSNDQLTWKADLPLNLCYKLRLVGLNSALVSNSSDHEKDRLLVLGQAQLDMPRAPGVLYLTLCHHPVSWLKDGDAVRTKLASRASLQLFGHVHECALQFVEDTLIVQAGALQPDRREEPCYPAYNILALDVTDEEGKHALSVEAFPRVWTSTHCFGQDPMTEGECSMLYSLPIDVVANLGASSASGVESEAAMQTTSAQVNSDLEYDMTNPAKRLAYGYLTLAYSTQMRIADKLSLLTDEDAGLESAVLFERLYKRTFEQERLAEFWGLVSGEQKNIDLSENPFRRNNE